MTGLHAERFALQCFHYVWKSVYSYAVPLRKLGDEARSPKVAMGLHAPQWHLLGFGLWQDASMMVYIISKALTMLSE